MLGVCDLLCNRLIDHGEKFKILFVLYTLGSFLIPTMNKSIDFSVMKILMHIDRIETFDCVHLFLVAHARLFHHFATILQRKI